MGYKEFLGSVKTGYVFADQLYIKGIVDVYQDIDSSHTEGLGDGEHSFPYSLLWCIVIFQR